ncbi:hypothetical protein NIES267_37280 [Calothrix parasitica NIES-267]|uniref:Uncharacterized protein n=1 Tax=Calothrix parasitica NIES-267 TaxID=1973488 RepID=A0A1Z4LSM8_9CYAN|nr:hypothetical protein NIES267_37280 [Calothrix parasitica NIES-267]
MSKAEPYEMHSQPETESERLNNRYNNNLLSVCAFLIII